MDYISAHNRRFSFLLDILLIFLGFHITFWLSTTLSGHSFFPYGQFMYYRTLLVTGFSWTTSVLFLGYHPSRRIVSLLQEFYHVLRVGVMALILLTLMMFIFKLSGFSRLFIGLFFIVTFVLLVGFRFLIRMILGVRRSAGFDQKTRIIVGTGSRAERYLAGVRAHKGNGIDVIGYLADSKETTDAPRLGTIDDLRKVLISHSVDGVVITLSVSHPKLEDVINECELHGVPVEFMLDGLTSKLSSSTLAQGMGTSRLVLTQNSSSSSQLVLKRVTDIVASAVLLAIISPVILAVAVAVKCDDGGPVMFAQERVGLHGRRFQIHKFRSMRIDAEATKSTLMSMNEMSGPVFKIRNDPRVTRVGHFLRKTSLDELPQLWDVLIGHMSLVGPRPPLPSEVDLYDVQYRRRLSVKPGITCLWQVSGRNNIDFDQWMALDMEYIDTWSYVSDWKILLRTIPAVFRRNGAS